MLDSLWSSLSTCVHFADSFTLGADWSIPYRKNPFTALWLLEEGEIEIRVGPKTYEVRSGDIILIPTGQPFRASYYSACRNHRTIALRFSLRTREQLDWFTLYRLQTHFPADQAACRHRAVREVLDTFHDADNPLGKMKANALMQLLLADLIRPQLNGIEAAALAGRRSAEMKAVTLIHWMEDHLQHKFTLKDLAEQVHISPDYIHDLFTAVVGETPMHYANRLRIRKACQLLLLKEHTVQEISEMTGFSSAQYFARVFKALEGMTPTEYQRASAQL